MTWDTTQDGFLNLSWGTSYIEFDCDHRSRRILRLVFRVRNMCHLHTIHIQAFSFVGFEGRGVSLVDSSCVNVFDTLSVAEHVTVVWKE